jgi:hypothetical protein
MAISESLIGIAFPVARAFDHAEQEWLAKIEKVMGEVAE